MMTMNQGQIEMQASFLGLIARQAKQLLKNLSYLLQMCNLLQ